jgi:glycogen debranching enzyme
MNYDPVIVEGGTPLTVKARDLPDQSAAAPDLRPYLLSGEKIIAVTEFPRRHRTAEPSGLHELLQLTRAKMEKDIGQNGPVIAATTLEKRENRQELHLYEAVFGRDSLRVAADLLHIYPELAKTTLIKLAGLQGQEWHAAREEEPGRIPHEIRDLESDRVAIELSEQRGWGWPYYGSVDATPEFIRLFTAYCRTAPDGHTLLDTPYMAKDGTKRVMAEALSEAIGWVERRMGANPEGFVEFKRAIPGGIENQVWRDSWDAFFHKDGTIADQEGIAALDVQRVVYDALLDTADLYRTLPHKQGEAELFTMQAKLLRERILETFWSDADGGYFVLGTDRDQTGRLRKLRIKTSDMGHVLHSRLLEGHEPTLRRKREAIISHLFSKEMLSPGGIRTLATDEVRFRPGAYHNGSVWLWDNYLIAQGLDQHGYHALANELKNRLRLCVTQTCEFPEYVRGESDEPPRVTTRIVDIWDEADNTVNRLEQPPQEVQAWSVSAWLAIEHEHTEKKRPDHRPGDFEATILRQIAE